MKKPLKLMVLIISSMAVLIAAGIGVYLVLKPSAHKHGKLTIQQQKALQVALPQMTTNVAGGGIVQFTVTLQANDKSTHEEIKTLIPTIQDTMNRLMRTYTTKEINSSSGIVKLKGNIAKAVDSQLPKGTVTKVLFTDIVTQ
ncbi:flagellar basal body-associated protein FliL [Alicyclobacillus sp. SO9]|uniref:flagellar basal body-associated FliL family protein n=1 Tax=Alicyclobacillus sp. SO9 TaxID=2665646 RepID=UPI0018E8FC5A|nr:flagellar basal body-associated FliL family protein [Alicyclobacillus sp. SO9]QQE80813.1 flagellar basal body-associated FliL family protein [Alicyclobacillus sp. SO9]